jgi:hypothetical protein
MSPLAREVLLWTCIVPFILCMIAGLLVLFEIWTPKNPKTGKWLLNSVVFLAVPAVGSFAIKLFTNPSEAGNGQNPPAPQAASAPASNLAQPARPVEAARAQPPENPPVAPSPAAQSALEPVPETLRPWAAEHLGQRADVDPAFESAYPSCVTDLRARAAEAVAPSEAEDCRRGLSEHHQRYLVPLYAERTRYGRKLTNELAILTRSEITPDNLPLLNFLTRENRNFNYAEGQAYQRFRGAERRINADIDLCDTNSCKARN